MSNLTTVNDVYIKSVKPRIKVYEKDERYKNESPVTKKISYINRTSKHINILERSGFILPIPANPSFNSDNELIIRIDYYFTPLVVKNKVDLILNALNNISIEIDDCGINARSQVTHSAFGSVEFTVEYPIYIYELEESGGEIFIKDLDILITTDENVVNNNHIFNDLNIIKVMTDKNDFNPSNLKFWINDPNYEHSEKYINILGSVTKIKSFKNKLCKSGLHLVIKDHEGRSSTVFFKIEDALEKCIIYNSAEDALSEEYNNNKVQEIEAKNKLLFLEKKKELETISFDLTETKLRNEQLEAQLESERNLAEHERSQIELKNKLALEESKARLEKLKEDFEKRSTYRKDTSEGIKTTAAIAAGIGALMIGIKNLLL